MVVSELLLQKVLYTSQWFELYDSKNTSISSRNIEMRHQNYIVLFVHHNRQPSTHVDGHLIASAPFRHVRPISLQQVSDVIDRGLRGVVVCRVSIGWVPGVPMRDERDFEAVIPKNGLSYPDRHPSLILHLGQLTRHCQSLPVGVKGHENLAGSEIATVVGGVYETLHGNDDIVSNVTDTSDVAYPVTESPSSDGRVKTPVD